MSNIAEFESILSLENPIKSSVVPRWQRKQQQSANSTLSDRFIPTRAAGLNSSDADMSLTTNNAVTGIEENEEYAKAVAQGLLGNEEKEARILAYKQKPPMPQDGYQNSMKVLYSQAGKKNEVVRSVRQIPSAPIRVLDAPDLLDDYYLNLLSWSCNNTLAVALSQTVYLWDAATGSIKDVMSVESEPEDYISSVAWIQEGGTHLAIGTNSNTVQMWDAVVGKKVRSLAGHSSRVGALAWNGHILSSGSRDTTIMTHDVRVANHVVGVLRNHTQEVCGLSWSPDGAYLASGANDNTLCIYDAASTLSFNGAAKHVITDHQAAVKALAWSPHERNLLASGGGTADRCIKFWNASSGALLNSVDTGSQVCALQWSPFEKELLSSHGFAENQLCLWKYPTMARTKELKGHSSRVLHMATSPDGSMVVSAAADETLRFWSVFGSEGKKKEAAATGGLSGHATLRISQ